MQDKKQNRGQGWTYKLAIYYNSYEEETLCEFPPMELKRDLPYMVGASMTKKGL